MQIKDREQVEGGRERVTVVPESVDDLWHLQYVLEPGDRVAGDTTRRIQRNDDQMRDTGGEREHMWVAIAVETVEFHKFANRLRVGGRSSPARARINSAFTTRSTSGARRALDREAVQTGSEGPTRGGRGSDRKPRRRHRHCRGGSSPRPLGRPVRHRRASDDHRDDRQGRVRPRPLGAVRRARDGA